MSPITLQWAITSNRGYCIFKEDSKPITRKFVLSKPWKGHIICKQRQQMLFYLKYTTTASGGINENVTAPPALRQKENTSPQICAGEEHATLQRVLHEHKNMQTRTSAWMLFAHVPPYLLSWFLMSWYAAKAKTQWLNSVNVTVVITSSPVTCTLF